MSVLLNVSKQTESGDKVVELRVNMESCICFLSHVFVFHGGGGAEYNEE